MVTDLTNLRNASPYKDVEIIANAANTTFSGGGGGVNKVMSDWVGIYEHVACLCVLVSQFSHHCRQFSHRLQIDYTHACLHTQVLRIYIYIYCVCVHFFFGV